MSLSRSAKRLCCLLAFALVLSGCSGIKEPSGSGNGTTDGQVSSGGAEETEASSVSRTPSAADRYDDLIEDDAVVVTADQTTIDIDDFVSSQEYVFVRNDLIGMNGISTAMIDASREYPVYAEGDSSRNVTQDLYLPTESDGIEIIWESSDESLISIDGRVTRPHEHSMFVVLTGTYVKDGKVLRARYPVRVARDLYADVTTDMVVELELYDQVWIFEEMGFDIENFDCPGWFYEYHDIEQVVFFEADPGNFSFRDRSDNVATDLTLSGTLSEMSIETEDEAYLFLYTFRNLTGWTDSYDMQLSGVDTGVSGQFFYNYVPYYNGIPTNGSVMVSISRFEDVKSVRSRVLTIPDGFDTEPSITYDEAVSTCGIEEPELMIVDRDGEIYLAWTGYAGTNILWVDAHTGDEILNTSAVIVNID